MQQARVLKILTAVLLIGVAAAWLWRRQASSREMAATPKQAVETAENTAPKTTPGASRGSTPASTPPVPVVHHEALALRQALAQFPQSFDEAVAAGDQEWASELLATKMTEATSVFSPTLFAPLHEMMMAHDFLWHDQDLVFMDWGGCLQQDCDRAGYRAQVQRVGGESSETNATLRCMESWEQLLPFALHPAAVNSQGLHRAKPYVQSCLQAAAGADMVFSPSVQMQAQYYLGFVRRLSGETAVTEAYAELSQSAPELPPLATLLPRS